MKHKNIILIILISFIYLFSFINVKSQIPDDVNGRLYRLCKVWGYQKYFSQHGGEYKWDSLLNIAIERVLLSKSQTEFNQILLEMLNEVPNNVYKETSFSMPDTNLNLDLNWLSDDYFSDDVKSYLTTFRDNFVPDTCTGLIKSSDYSMNLTNEYTKLFSNGQVWNYLIESKRLNIMFFYWNIVNYFYPYKNLMDRLWDSTLLEFIPRIREISTIKEFHILMLKLITRQNDSHGFLSSSVLDMFWNGNYIPKIYFLRVENQCVVVKIDEQYPEIKLGDILLKINGIGLDSLENYFRELIPASTEAAFYRDFYLYMFRGAFDTYIDLTLQNENAEEYDIRVYREENMYNLADWAMDNGREEPYYLTKCGYGYLNMQKLQSGDIPGMREDLKDAPAIIIDLRQYAKVGLEELLPYFFEGPITSAKVLIAALTYPQKGYCHYPGWFYIGDDSDNFNPWTPIDTYQGKIIILVNQFTQSYLEYDCQYLSFHPNVKVIGTQSAGADGNVCHVSLPSGIGTQFTGLGWYYADWYQQQSNGVRIDSLVEITIEGIRKGRDEILEAAFDCLVNIEEIRLNNNFEIYPNPAGDYIEVNSSADSRQQSADEKLKEDIRIYNTLGQCVITEGTINELPMRIDISNLPIGVYYIKIGSIFEKFIKFNY